MIRKSLLKTTLTLKAAFRSIALASALHDNGDQWCHCHSPAFADETLDQALTHRGIGSAMSADLQAEPPAEFRNFDRTDLACASAAPPGRHGEEDPEETEEETRQLGSIVQKYMQKNGASVTNNLYRMRRMPFWRIASPRWKASLAACWVG